MEKNIIVPTDFTQIAEKGISTAISIAKRVNSKITLLHVIEENIEELRFDGDTQANQENHNEFDHFMAQLFRTRRTMMYKLINSLSHENVKIDAHFAYGDFQTGLSNYLEENKVDLIVMGTSGETNLSEIFSGNHALQTVDSAKIPVLAVKESISFSELNSLLLLINSYEYEERSIQTIKNMVDLLKLNLNIAYVKELRENNRGLIKSMMEYFSKENELDPNEISVIPFGDKIDQIEEYVKEHNIDLVAFISKSKPSLIKVFQGSTTEKFINELEKPVLVVPEG